MSYLALFKDTLGNREHLAIRIFLMPFPLDDQDWTFFI